MPRGIPFCLLTKGNKKSHGSTSPVRLSKKIHHIVHAALRRRPCWCDYIFDDHYLSRIRKSVRAHAARALPFPFGRKRKQKGPFRHGTAAAGRFIHGRTRSAKLPKLDHSRDLRHLGSFVSALPCAAGQKSPHEPRR